MKMDTSNKNNVCGICNKEIRRNESCIACTRCEEWIHFTCNKLSRKDVKKLDVQTFICIACAVQKKSSSKKRKTMVPVDKTLTDTNIKVESGSDGEFEEFEGYANISTKMSEFELARLENIKRNQEMFEQFKIMEAKENLAPKKRKIDIVGLKIKKEKKECEGLPTRKSLRIQNILAETDNVTTHEQLKYQASVDNNFCLRKPAEMNMKCINVIKEDEFESTVKGWIEDDFDPANNNDERYSKDIVKYKEKMSSLEVTDLAKLTQSRAYSMAWYPSKTKKIICVGDKKGSIGIWDVNCAVGNDFVFLFDVHAACPIPWLSFSPFDPTKIYSCSYDGTLTCGDFNQMVFSQKYVCEDDTTLLHHFAWPRYNRNTILCSTSDGEVITLDLVSGKAEQTFQLNSNGKKRAGRCIDCHPLNEYVIATSLSDGTLATWDLRMITKKADNCLSSFKSKNTIVKAFFSPITGNKLLMTSQDHYLRVFDVKDSGIMATPPRHPIKHKNYYGSWLTTFRAVWDPKTDHSFVCGSMDQPRCLDMYGCDEKSHNLMSYKLESANYIFSVNVFHPHFDLLASSNGSGKTAIWSLPPTV